MKKPLDIAISPVARLGYSHVIEINGRPWGDLRTWDRRKTAIVSVEMFDETPENVAAGMFYSLCAVIDPAPDMTSPVSVAAAVEQVRALIESGRLPSPARVRLFRLRERMAKRERIAAFRQRAEDAIASADTVERLVAAMEWAANGGGRVRFIAP